MRYTCIYRNATSAAATAAAPNGSNKRPRTNSIDSDTTGITDNSATRNINMEVNVNHINKPTLLELIEKEMTYAALPPSTMPSLNARRARYLKVLRNLILEQDPTYVFDEPTEQTEGEDMDI